ncbi:MAG: hypothetical protein JO171_13370 [Paludibacterium sp.]|uniref:hypothetical protein n=1 Tax=Paludibacterium sp. TaxID=1917523 RepID=UPI0025D06963|nr:hypothetical protein [Paludibacterium sp.]MBV8048144.1 hypothetical protein [Paludibacterium sp.]MBV8648656.1 hypothetical protein [Paludibacterium sp.]
MNELQRAARQRDGKYRQAIEPNRRAPWQTLALLDADIPPILLFAVPAIKKASAANWHDDKNAFVPSIPIHI